MKIYLTTTANSRVAMSNRLSIVLLVLIGGAAYPPPGRAEEDVAPAPYTVKFAAQYRWLSIDGKVKQYVPDIQVTTAVGRQRIFIEPQLTDPARVGSIGFMPIGSSPLRPGEWILLFPSLPSDSRRSIEVAIDKSPAPHFTDLFANLGRILYTPTNHPSYRGVPAAERYYLAHETTGNYRPEEVSYETRYMHLGEADAVSEITAISPPYCNTVDGKRVSFSPAGAKRKLWRITINQYTNWHKMLLPASFNFTRYDDAEDRVKTDNDAPISVCDAVLTSITKTAKINIEARLQGKQIRVQDWRPMDELHGSPAYYTVTGMAWPEMGSPDYTRFVEASRADLSPRLSFPGQ